jgi:hypothetical protein
MDNSQQFSWIAGVDTRLGDVFCHDASGPDDHIVADFDWQYRSVSAYGHPMTHFGCFPQRTIAACGAAGLEGIVDKHGAVRNEAVIADFDQLTDESVRLNLGALTDTTILLDFHKRADEAAVANAAAVKVRGLDDRDIHTEIHVFDRG